VIESNGPKGRPSPVAHGHSRGRSSSAWRGRCTWCIPGPTGESSGGTRHARRSHAFCHCERTCDQADTDVCACPQRVRAPLASVKGILSRRPPGPTGVARRMVRRRGESARRAAPPTIRRAPPGLRDRAFPPRGAGLLSGPAPHQPLASDEDDGDWRIPVAPPDARK
jgi:hypothetical protein